MSMFQLGKPLEFITGPTEIMFFNPRDDHETQDDLGLVTPPGTRIEVIALDVEGVTDQDDRQAIVLEVGTAFVSTDTDVWVYYTLPSEGASSMPRATNLREFKAGQVRAMVRCLIDPTN